MPGFIALAWRPDAEPAAARIKEALVRQGQLRLAVDRRALAVFLDRDLPLGCVQLPGLRGVVVGTVFERSDAMAGRGRAAELSRFTALDPATLSRQLAREVWGSYVALLTDTAGGLNLFRDPLGALECLTWARDGVQVAASRFNPSDPHAPRRASVDWPALASLLRQKNLSSDIVPINGVQGVSPGVLRRADGVEERVWRPAGFCRTDALRSDCAPRDLAAAVDGCVAAWAGGRERILCEVSGGLDSAIVAAALQRCRAPVLAAINHHWAEPEADERVFARAVAEHVGVQLTEQAHGLLALDEASLGATASSARPSFAAADPTYDAAMAAHIDATGADGLFTGQGGDAVFFQMTGAVLAADLMRGVPAPAPAMRALALLAMRSRRTVWSLLGQAWRTRGQPVPLHQPVSFLASGYADLRLEDRHPWLRDLDAVAPAKQLQVQCLTNNQSMFGDSLRGRGGQLIQPLMSQPVVELCLAIPAPLLAIGELDRPFARAAFGARLPDAVLGRRWKGDLSVFFARSMAANLPFLRHFLLDGQLAAQGLIDPDKLALVLDPDVLIWFDHFGELTLAFLLEAWARWWAAALPADKGS